MNHDEFLAESLTFSPGIVVISGPDLAQLFLLAMDARDAVIAAGIHSASVIDAKAQVEYPSDTKERGVVFEYVSLTSTNTVVFVVNQFDRTKQNSHASLEVDVMFDLISGRTVETIPESLSKTFPGFRNICPFIY
jgi:hypothetical protein